LVDRNIACYVSVRIFTFSNSVILLPTIKKLWFVFSFNVYS